MQVSAGSIQMRQAPSAALSALCVRTLGEGVEGVHQLQLCRDDRRGWVDWWRSNEQSISQSVGRSIHRITHSPPPRPNPSRPQTKPYHTPYYPRTHLRVAAEGDHLVHLLELQRDLTEACLFNLSCVWPASQMGPSTLTTTTPPKPHNQIPKHKSAYRP